MGWQSCHTSAAVTAARHVGGIIYTVFQKCNFVNLASACKLLCVKLDTGCNTESANNLGIRIIRFLRLTLFFVHIPPTWQHSSDCTSCILLVVFQRRCAAPFRLLMAVNIAVSCAMFNFILKPKLSQITRCGILCQWTVCYVVQRPCDDFAVLFHRINIVLNIVSLLIDSSCGCANQLYARALL